MSPLVFKECTSNSNPPVVEEWTAFELPPYEGGLTFGNLEGWRKNDPDSSTVWQIKDLVGPRFATTPKGVKVLEYDSSPDGIWLLGADGKKYCFRE